MWWYSHPGMGDPIPDVKFEKIKKKTETKA